MKRLEVLLLTSLLLILAAVPDACGQQSERTAPLLDGLGEHHHPITTDDSLAQTFFDQGLVLAFAFNHAEAARSFREAQRLDPDCAMCYWGEALVLGPNINAAMDPANAEPAYEALQQALRRQGKTDQAQDVERRFRDAWRHADISLTASRL